MNPTTIVIIDNHKLVCEAWSVMLNMEAGFTVTATCGSAEEGIRLCESLQPDIVLLEIKLPGMNGMDAVRIIRKIAPRSRIVVVSATTQTYYVKRVMKDGAVGFLTKNSSRVEMINALKHVALGNNFICNEIKDVLAENIIQEGKRENSLMLSDRELQIINLIKQGFSSREISVSLSISLKTVEAHRYNILKKLNLKNSAALVEYVWQTELVV